MNIKCPSCHTLFEIDKKVIANKDNINLKCSVCKNTWLFDLKETNKKNVAFSFKLLFLIALLVTAMSVMLILYFKDYFISLGGYWLNIIDLIEKLVPIQ